MPKIANKILKYGDHAQCDRCGAKIYWCGVSDTGSPGEWLTAYLNQRAYLKATQYSDEFENVAYRESKDCKVEDFGTGQHIPREWCWIMNDDYEYCARPVSYEDYTAELYCCGRHRQRAKAMRSERQRLLKARERSRADQALAEFEQAEYEACRQWFVDNGYERLVDGYAVKRNSYTSGINRAVTINLFELKEVLESYGKDTECEQQHTEESESSSLVDSWLSVLEQDSST